MKIKSCLLITLILLAGCNQNVTTSMDETSNKTTSSISSEKSSSDVKTSSEVQFDNTPYAYEVGTITLPEDNKVDGRDWIGKCFDITEAKHLFPNTDSIIFQEMFDREWKYYEVLEKDGAPAYASEDHKPVLEFDSVLLSDIDQLPETYNVKNTNVEIPLASYKNFINKRTKLNSTEYEYTLVYHGRANAIYYTESFPSFDTFKDECIAHADSFVISSAKEACKSNTKEAYANFFSKRGTHVIWSCAYGMGVEYIYEANTHDYKIDELATKEVKTLFDSAVLSGIDSKTVGEYEQRKNFNLNDYLNVEEGKYVFEWIIQSSLYGGKAEIPGMSFSSIANSINKLMTSKTEDVKESTFLTPREAYPIWEFLPSSMAEEKTLLENAYKEYVKDKTEYYTNLANA